MRPPHTLPPLTGLDDLAAGLPVLQRVARDAGLPDAPHTVMAEAPPAQWRHRQQRGGVEAPATHPRGFEGHEKGSGHGPGSCHGIGPLGFLLHSHCGIVLGKFGKTGKNSNVQKPKVQKTNNGRGKINR